MRLIDEKKLLERDPIIAPDGYIPNSVIRRKLKPPKHEPPVRVERRWKLKPVPKADPKYMPKGWGAVEKEKERTPPPRLVVRKWEDTPTPTASDRSVASSLSSVSLKSTPPTPPRLLKKFIRECHAKPKSESKSAKTAIAESKSRENTQASTVTLTPPFVENKSPGVKKYSRENSLSERVIHWTPSPKPGSAAAASPDVTHYDIESQSPTTRSKQTSSEMLEELRRKRKSAHDRAKLADMAVEEESEEMKKQKSIMESELIKRLLDEKWMPIVDPSVEDYGNVLAKLLRLLDDHNPMVYNSVIDYLIALYKELGMIAEILDSIIAKLGANLNSLNIAIKRHTLRGLQVVGTGRTDVLRMILPKLIDEEEAVRKAAAEAILVLTGAKDKETLFNYLDSHGVTEGIYNSKEDEEFAFRVLAERLAEGAEDPAYFDRLEARIMDWVERTTPGLISEDMNPEDLEEQLWKNGSRKSSMYKSREQSFMSEKSDDETTPRERGSVDSESRVVDSRSTVSQRLHDGSIISDGRTSSPDTTAHERITPRDPHFFRVFDSEPKPGPGSQEEHKEERVQAEASSKIMERLSGQDSGIGQDIASELSQKGKVPPHGALSPVKSEESITTNRQQQQKQQQQHETLDKDWRKFFELPTAIERHQMELIKHELAQGKLKQTQLPPISYFARDLPMLPGEAGTRLLQTVRVGEKEVTSGDGRHRIQPVPGKLAVHTQNESEGSSCFGIIQMEWTTGVPTMKDPTHPPQRLPRYRLITEETAQYLPPLHTRLSQLSHLDRMRLGTSDTDLHLPNLTTASSTPTASQRLSPSVSHRLSPGFEWELPLPPPPAKESRTVIPYIKKEHDTYCKYYQLVKKKLHLYTSKQRERSLSLPTVITKSMTGNQHTDGTRLHHRSRDNSNLTMGTGQQLLPPIKLGQLINI